MTGILSDDSGAPDISDSDPFSPILSPIDLPASPTYDPASTVNPIIPPFTPVVATPPNIQSSPGTLTISPINVPPPPNTIVTPSGAATPAPGFVMNSAGDVAPASASAPYTVNAAGQIVPVAGTNWLVQSSIPGVQNSYLVVGGFGVLLVAMLSKKKKRR